MRFITLTLLSLGLCLIAACSSQPAPQPTQPAAVSETTAPTPAGVVTATAEPPTPAQAYVPSEPTSVAMNDVTPATPPEQTPLPVAPVPMDSPFVGSYGGILPAADAIARVVTLDLGVDGSATMTTEYIGKGAPIVENGTWTEANDLARVIFTVRDGKPQDNRITWQLKDNQLTTVEYDAAQYGSAGLPMNRIGSGVTNQAEYGGVTFRFDTSLAQSAQGSTQPAVPADQNAPALGGGTPVNIRFLFDNATAPDYFDPHLPQVYVYPVAGLKALDPGVAKNVEDLQKILADKTVAPDQDIPIFPVMPASQVFHAQTRFLDFINGSGVSFVTAYKQDASALTNQDIFYTFQGITFDGAWYVAVYWNVSTPALPDTVQAAQAVLPADVTAEQFETYLAQTVAVLDALPPVAFVPNLRLLDQMNQSIRAEPEIETPKTPAPNATVITPANADQSSNAQALTAEFGGASLNYSADLAQSTQGYDMAAVPADTNAPALGGGAPAHIAFGFNNETLTTDVSPFQPAVRIYPTADLKALDPMVAQQVLALKTMLDAKPPTLEQPVPVFPVFNAQQVIHPQIKYLNFKNGQGVRFATYYAQDVSPITNDGLFYTFQGLTDDGKYYVTAFWHLRSDQLPNSYQDAKIQDYDAFAKQFETYIKATSDQLNTLPPEAFTPNLNALDQMVESIQTPQ